MRQIAWLTDIHLDMLAEEQLEQVCDGWRALEADAVLIGGDIAEAPHLLEYLALLDATFERPLYFVLGNHDFYRGSIREVRAAVAAFCADRPHLHYLTVEGPHALTDSWGLVGHDGWADARLGDYERSMVMLNDYELIAELKQRDKAQRWPLLHQLGEEAAAHVAASLQTALENFSHVLLLTHVPPTRSSCWYNGEVSDDEWAPHFTCKAVGDAILATMRRHPAQQLTVLCGHTHSPGETWPLPNVRILTGRAEYGRPEIQRLLELDESGKPKAESGTKKPQSPKKR